MSGPTVTIYSDLHCPWAFVAIHRLREARAARGLDVVFDQRAWPLEWINGSGAPRHIVEPETAVLANHEEELFSKFTGKTWPTTFVPAFELVAAARRVGGLPAAEDIDYQLRLRFFRHSADLSLRHELHEALLSAARVASWPPGQTDEVWRVWAREAVRSDVLDDYEASRDLPIEGSPQIFWPDGTTSHNPGMADHHWVRGLLRIGRTDPNEPGRLLAERIAPADGGYRGEPSPRATGLA